MNDIVSSVIYAVILAVSWTTIILPMFFASSEADILCL